MRLRGSGAQKGSPAAVGVLQKRLATLVDALTGEEIAAIPLADEALARRPGGARSPLHPRPPQPLEVIHIQDRGEVVCSLNSAVTVRAKGQSKFVNVSNELLFITYVNSLGQTVTVPLFDTSLQNYFWQYDNQGQKIVQMRFYPQ